MAKFSVIVPVYNVERYLERCFLSILQQTNSDFEVIAVDDGSTDGSAKIIEKYSNKDSRINVVTQKNQGLAMARNNGLKMANGEYVLFVDSDDYISRETLEILEDATKTIDVDIVIFDYNEVKGEKLTLRSGYSLKVVENHKLSFPTAAWNKLYRRNYIANMDELFMENMYYEDFSVVPYLVAKTRNVLYINKILYYYDISRNDNIMKDKSIKNKEILDVSKRLVELFKEGKIFNEYREALLEVILPRLLDCAIKNRMIDSHNNSVLFYDECIEFLNNTFYKWRDNSFAFKNYSDSKMLTVARKIVSVRLFFMLYSIINPRTLIKRKMK